jgi:hypothetical protein
MARDKRVARRLGAVICFEDESGLTLKPAKARTWAPRGHTPVVKVPGRRGPRLSIAGMVGYQPGTRGRLFYRQVIHRGRKNEPKGLREQDFVRLLDAAHQQLSAPIVLVWDKLPGHRSALMRQFIAARSWLRVYYLPAYAPELNPAEGVWSSLRRAMGNLAADTVTDLVAAAKTRLKRMQYHPSLIDGFLAATRLSPPRP